MFGWWGQTVVRLRWWVIAGAVALVIVGAGWGAGVFGALSGGGFDDPNSPSSRANARIEQEIGPQGADVLVLYTNPSATVDDAALRDPVAAALDQLRGRPEVVQVVSYYSTQAPDLVSADRHATYAAIRLREEGGDAKRADLKAIRPLLDAGSGVRTEVGGTIGFLSDASQRIEDDVVRAELLSLPILLLLMIFIFRGLVAATMPLIVGGVAILGALTVTRVITNFTDISVFAANVITMLGLGMAIDYALFVVSRFREELAAGASTSDAIARTIATAGRTVVVSGLTVALALSSLLLFPMGFLKSMGYGGMAAVGVAMIAALTVLPAVLALLGPRINAGRVAFPGRRRAAESTRVGGWARLARSVMRRPVFYVVAV